MADESAVFKLKNVNAETAPVQELRNLIGHLQEQMNNRYVYLVGEWAKGHRIRSTRDGQFVSKEELLRYLETD